MRLEAQLQLIQFSWDVSKTLRSKVQSMLFPVYLLSSLYVMSHTQPDTDYHSLHTR